VGGGDGDGEEAGVEAVVGTTEVEEDLRGEEVGEAAADGRERGAGHAGQALEEELVGEHASSVSEVVLVEQRTELVVDAMEMGTRTAMWRAASEAPSAGASSAGGVPATAQLKAEHLGRIRGPGHLEEATDTLNFSGRFTGYRCGTSQTRKTVNLGFRSLCRQTHNYNFELPTIIVVDTKHPQLLLTNPQLHALLQRLVITIRAFTPNWPTRPRGVAMARGGAKSSC
jgi:hypothetical protein